MKAQYTAGEKNKYRPDGPRRFELRKIFHTTRHPFDPKSVNPQNETVTVALLFIWMSYDVKWCLYAIE